MTQTHFLSLSRRLWWVRDRIEVATLDPSTACPPAELAALRRRELRLSELILSFLP